MQRFSRQLQKSCKEQGRAGREELRSKLHDWKLYGEGYFSTSTVMRDPIYSVLCRDWMARLAISSDFMWTNPNLLSTSHSVTTPNFSNRVLRSSGLASRGSRPTKILVWRHGNKNMSYRGSLFRQKKKTKKLDVLTGTGLHQFSEPADRK